MSGKSAIFILGIALMLVLGSMQVGGSGTYFSDTRTSTGNTLTAGIWSGQPARPSLSLDPDDAEIETSDILVTHIINVCNTSDDPKDVALNVILEVSST